MKSMNYLLLLFICMPVYVLADETNVQTHNLSNTFFWANGWANSTETNIFYILDDGNLNIHDDPAIPDGKRYCIRLDSDQIRTIKTTKECKPADEFSQGNWGKEQGGFQLSLRFDKQVFTNGEPITATLLLRNITGGSLNYSKVPVGYNDGPIGFQVTSSERRIVSKLPFSIGNLTVNPMIGIMFPGTQAKYLERLDKRFVLTNGMYSIQAVSHVGALMASPTIENGKVIWHPANPADIYTVKSAKVKITIESAH